MAMGKMGPTKTPAAAQGSSTGRGPAHPMHAAIQTASKAQAKRQKQVRSITIPGVGTFPNTS
jgi:hypothetical protein